MKKERKKERKKEVVGEQKDMGQKLVSKPDVISMSEVIYPYVSKKRKLTRLAEPSATEIFSYIYIYIYIYMFHQIIKTNFVCIIYLRSFQVF